MAYILAIEAASDSCSVALLDTSTQKIHQRLEAAPRMHSRLLYPMLNDLLNEAALTPNQLDAVAFVKGPGSFTGLRIAAASAQGIGFANDIPLIGISTLQAMAQQAFIQHQSHHVLSIMDARMGELYLGQYSLDQAGELMQPLINDQICAIEADTGTLALKPSNDIYAVGHGLKLKDKMHQSLKSLCEKSDQDQVLEAQYLLPLAQHLFKKGDTLTPDEVELVYLREQSHWKTIKEQKALREANLKNK